METINHFLNLNKYICENYCSLNYDWNYLFSESVVQLFLEMKITPERLELARELGFNKFLVGSEPPKESLVVEFGSLKVAEDAAELLKAIISEKLSEIKDGVKTTLVGEVELIDKKLVFKVFNQLEKFELRKCIDSSYFGRKLSEDGKVKLIDDYIQKFKSFEREQSEPIKVDLKNEIDENELLIDNPNYNKEKANKFWNKIFDILGGFVGYVRSQWIFKFGAENEKQITVVDGEKEITGEEPVIINEELNGQAEDHPRFFHVQVGSPYNRQIFRVINELNQKYGVKIKIKYDNKKTRKNKIVIK